jgi:predicted amidohydrolase YtcJ
VAGIGVGLAPRAGDRVIDAGGSTLLPGLHDHHIHMVALAASLDSLRCGPPDIQSADELASLLRSHNAMAGAGWIRGIAYHPCVAGDIDRDWLDRYIPDRPARIQHRGGRLWVLNSRALQELAVPSVGNPAGVEVVNGRATGRLYEADQWLRARLGSQFPDLGKASNLLASYGVTGITDTTPANGAAEWRYFQQSQLGGQLHQSVRMMGSHQIQECPETEQLQRGEFKVHLLESRLPDLDTLGADIAAAHCAGRSVAVHCVTLIELVFALSALETAGVRLGDRIEHASITPPDMLQTIRAMGLRVVTQPHFIAERGDQYLAEVENGDQPWLYRAAGFISAGIPLAGGSDAPFGSADPWRAMRAAVERKTPGGRVMAAREALSPEQALSLFLSRPEAPGVNDAGLAIGARADLCLLHGTWQDVRNDLSSRHIRSTWRAGKLIYCSD